MKTFIEEVKESLEGLPDDLKSKLLKEAEEIDKMEEDLGDK